MALMPTIRRRAPSSSIGRGGIAAGITGGEDRLWGPAGPHFHAGRSSSGPTILIPGIPISLSAFPVRKQLEKHLKRQTPFLT
jgi:hypothetical protein